MKRGDGELKEFRQNPSADILECKLSGESHLQSRTITDMLFRKFRKKKPLEPGKFSKIVALLWIQASAGVNC